MLKIIISLGVFITLAVPLPLHIGYAGNDVGELVDKHVRDAI